MKRYLLLAAIGLAFIPIQIDIKNIVDKLTAYSLKYPQEKVFIHFDKPNYSIGETVWFKTYLLDAFSNEPVALSKVVYVELFDSNMKMMDKKMLKIELGGAAGDFLLPDSIPSGTYHIRAYTNWMRNFDEAFFYNHSFRVLETQKEEQYAPYEIEPTLSFFPEGGDLINNVSSILAIKATDQFGKGIEIIGEVVDDLGNVITMLETDERGMGAIIITPKKGQKQTARIRFKEKLFDFNLPEVQGKGYALRVINNFQSEKIIISVESSQTPLANSGIIAHKSGEVFYSIENLGNESSFMVRLDRKDFPSGICHITFFDPNGIPQAERLVYANYPKVGGVELSKEEGYDKRSLISLGVNVKDMVRNVPSNLSISITPRDVVSHSENDENIANYLQLSSDLVGDIEQPGFYLQVNNQSFKSLDLLLLTQGWRRFKWKDVLHFDEGKTQKFWIEEGITFSGQIVDYYNRKKSRPSRVSLSILNDQPSFTVGETDDNGNFFFSGIEFHDSTRLLIQAARKLKKEGKYREDVFIKLHDLEAPELALAKYQPIHISIEKESQYQSIIRKIEQLEEEFTPDGDAIMLDEVQVATFRDPFDDPFEKVFKIYTDPTQRVVVDSIMRGVPVINIYDVLSRIPGVRVIGSFPQQSVIIGGIGSVAGGIEPLYIYDGVYIEKETLLSLPSTNISHIDILKNADAAIYGSQGSNGVIAIYSKTGIGVVTQKSSKKMGVLAHHHPGYSKVREFFSPNYAKPIDEHAKPDFRTTLYWNPTIITGGGKAAPVSFYSSDQTGTFDIIVQGITVDGVPVFLKDSLVVE